MVGLNVRLRAPQWAYMLSHSGARLAIAADEFAVDLAAAGKEAGLEPERVRNVDDLMTGRRQTWGFTAEQRPAEDATFAVVYTSGTTGRPKASRVVHRCSIHSATTYVHVIGMTGADRTAVAFPLYYITGLHAHLLPMMLVGGTSVLLADARPPEYVAALAAERITWMYVVLAAAAARGRLSLASPRPRGTRRVRGLAVPGRGAGADPGAHAAAAAVRHLRPVGDPLPRDDADRHRVPEEARLGRTSAAMHGGAGGRR
jgi:acyl-coenzyme A synthetase/AMP-(fatty) acid ligase